MDKQKLAEEMLKLAKMLVSEQEETDEGDVEDPKFMEKIRNLRQVLTKLSQKKRRRLQQFGIGLIRPNATVEDLVDALMKVAVG
jgi:non-homologous end joining protein Ku